MTTRLCTALIASALLATFAVPVAAQENATSNAASNFGCSRLDTVQPAPVIEGLQGMFFRLSDMRMNHPLSDQTIDLMAEFSDALAEHGTTLIYLPLPTKGLVLPDLLPDVAADYGYDFEIASTIYQEFVARLQNAGVTTIDVQTPLLGLAAEDFPFMAPDFHWSSSGARATAVAVGALIRAHPDYAALKPVPHVTRALGPQDVVSTFRQSIQMRCREQIPTSQAQAFETSPVETGVSAGAGIFATDAGRPGIVLVGTSMSQTPQFNFDGFLAEAAQLEVMNYSVTGGNQFGALLGYMMSGDFIDNPPHFLVWENPVYNNLGNFAGYPLREATMAARDTCTPIAAELTPDGALVAIDFAASVKAGDFLRAFSASSGAYAAEFALGTLTGLAHGNIDRTLRGDPTPLFYLAIDQFTEITSIEVTFDRRPGADASLALCSNERTSG